MTNAEIQVGEYVRTKDGYIGKIDRAEGYDFTSIKSHSFNIIDLIEVGDYVNGILAVKITVGILDNGKKWIYIWRDKDNVLPAIALREETIKTIVTKEQFKSMEYKVGGEDEQSR